MDWDRVRINEDFISAFERVTEEGPDGLRTVVDLKSFDAEARLLYMASTRGRVGVELPDYLVELFGIHSSRCMSTAAAV